MKQYDRYCNALLQRGIYCQAVSDCQFCFLGNLLNQVHCFPFTNQSSIKRKWKAIEKRARMRYLGSQVHSTNETVDLVIFR